MKNIILILTGIIFMTTTSCIKWGLDELPLHEDAEITNFNYEFRYTIQNANGIELMNVKKLSTQSEVSGTDLTNTVTVPAASGTFTPEVISQINLTNLVGYANISLAAKIEPEEGAPDLGTPGDFTNVVKYRVTAANGDSKIWTVTTILIK